LWERGRAVGGGKEWGGGRWGKTQTLYAHMNKKKERKCGTYTKRNFHSHEEE
jgi:hypothetical protein